jgi:hypothetical protein
MSAIYIYGEGRKRITQKYNFVEYHAGTGNDEFGQEELFFGCASSGMSPKYCITAPTTVKRISRNIGNAASCYF